MAPFASCSTREAVPGTFWHLLASLWHFRHTYTQRYAAKGQGGRRCAGAAPLRRTSDAVKAIVAANSPSGHPTWHRHPGDGYPRAARRRRRRLLLRPRGRGWARRPARNRHLTRAGRSANLRLGWPGPDRAGNRQHRAAEDRHVRAGVRHQERLQQLSQWLAGGRVADRRGPTKCVLVTVGETPSRDVKWHTTSRRDLRLSFPGYTLGDAGVAALVVPASEEPRIIYRSFCHGQPLLGRGHGGWRRLNAPARRRVQLPQWRCRAVEGCVCRPRAPGHLAGARDDWGRPLPTTVGFSRTRCRCRSCIPSCAARACRSSGSS
jgi:hypothetical protein